MLPNRRLDAYSAFRTHVLTFFPLLQILLTIAAVVSLALGFFQDFGPSKPVGPKVDWVEGVAIIIAILIVVLVGSINDYQKERQFKVLNSKKEERTLKIIRGGAEKLIDVKDVVVGDIAILEPGEIVPVDGVFLSGHGVRCDESGATGESDAIKKVPYAECLKIRDEKLREWKRSPNSGRDTQSGNETDSEEAEDDRKRPSGMDLLGHTDCFIVSGAKVTEGTGTYVVVAVGTKSFNGRIMMGEYIAVSKFSPDGLVDCALFLALRGDAESTPLQLKLNDLAELIAKAGSLAGLILFSALMIRFFVQLGTNDPAR